MFLKLGSLYLDKGSLLQGGSLLPLKTIVSPWKLFIFTWVIVGLLFETRFSYLLDGLTSRFSNILIMLLLTYTLGYLVSCIILGRMKSSVEIKPSIQLNTIKLNKVTKKLLKFWISCSVLEIIISGGVPFIWLLIGSDKTYFDFGIKGVHGLVNAIYGVIIMSYGILYVSTKQKKYLRYVGILFLWTIVLITRQLLVLTLIELVFLLLLSVKLSVKVYAKILLGMLIMVCIFGWLGDFRSGHDAFIALAQPRYEWLTNIPSGVLWVLIYITTPIANMQHIEANVIPEDTFVHSLGLLLPSPIRNELFASNYDIDSINEILITPAFNVCSYMVDFYLDFGLPYLFIFTFIIGFLARLTFMRMCTTRKYRWILAYCTLNAMLLLSLFNNMFFYLPVLGQVILGFFIDSKKLYLR